MYYIHSMYEVHVEYMLYTQLTQENIHAQWHE